jgi:DNA-binding GntR family transcriptional regulator
MACVDGSASERAYDWTRGRILDATFAPSSMITEGEIAGLVGVSRTPVREAFLRLAGEGFLRLYPKRGAMVVPVTEADVREVLEARLLVEPWAAGVAAGRADHGDLARTLAVHVRDLEGADAGGDAAAYQEADRAFHVTIVEATGNRLLAEFYGSLRDRQLRMGATALVVSRGRDRTILTEHRAIVDAIGSGDPDLAATTVRDHVRSTQAALRTASAS